jgi:hypothetical protein
MTLDFTSKRGNKGRIMKLRLITIVIICLMLVGCASLGPQISKFDLANYKANKQLALDGMTTWSLNSGFITGLGLTNPIAFPITTNAQLKAVINSPAAVLALSDLDAVVKRQGKWSDVDFDLGFFLGTKVRAGSQAAIQFIKDYLPQLMEYAPMLFAL